MFKYKTGFVVVLVLALIVSTQSITAAQNKTIIVRVDGLSCPFCAYGLEKKLKKLEDVEDLTINMEEGTAELTVKEGAIIPIDKIKEAVKDAGFTPKEIKTVEAKK